MSLLDELLSFTHDSFVREIAPTSSRQQHVDLENGRFEPQVS